MSQWTAFLVSLFLLHVNILGLNIFFTYFFKTLCGFQSFLCLHYSVTALFVGVLSKARGGKQIVVSW